MSLVLGPLDAVPEDGSAAYIVETAAGRESLMVVRKNGGVYAYVNVCPHRRMPLDFKPGEFLDPDREFILCTNHIALFAIETGECVDGPCRGQGLEPVPFAVEDGAIVVDAAWARSRRL